MVAARIQTVSEAANEAFRQFDLSGQRKLDIAEVLPCSRLALRLLGAPAPANKSLQQALRAVRSRNDALTEENFEQLLNGLVNDDSAATGQKLFVKSLSGDTIAEFNVDHETSVQEVRLKLRDSWQEVDKIPHNIVLVAEGRILQDEDGLLGACGVLRPGRDGMLHAVRGGAPTRQALVGGSDGSLWIWDTSGEGGRFRELVGHTGPIRALAASWEHKLALSASNDHSLKLWNLDAITLEREFRGHRSGVRDVSADWESMRALSGSADRTMRIWNLSTGCCECCILDGHSGYVLAVDADWAKNRAASASSDGSLRLWTLPTDEARAQSTSCITVCKGYIFAMAIGWSNSLALCGGADAALHVWDLGEEASCTQSLKGHQGPIRSIVANWLEMRAVSGSSDGFLRLWDIAGGVCLFELGCHTGPVRALTADWARNEVLSGAEDGTLVSWVLGQEGAIRKWTQSAQTAVLTAIVSKGANAIVSQYSPS